MDSIIASVSFKTLHTKITSSILVNFVLKTGLLLLLLLIPEQLYKLDIYRLYIWRNNNNNIVDVVETVI